MAQQENPLWGNPCGHPDQVDSKVVKKYELKQVKQVEQLVKIALHDASLYKEDFGSTLHSKKFDQLVDIWSGNEFLRNTQWHLKEVLPDEKVIGKNLTEDYIKKLVMDDSKMKKVLPAMFKSMKLLVAGLEKIITMVLSDGLIDNDALKNKINNTMMAVRNALCPFSIIIKGLDLNTTPLYESDIPDFLDFDRTKALLVYRDTLNFLEYLAEVFHTIYDMKKDYTLAAKI